MIPELRMRERELKKEWIDAARETKQRQRAQRQSELSEVRRNVRRGVLAFWVKLGRSRVSIKSNGAFCLFFFFFFEFRPESAVSADSSPSWPDFGRIGPSRSRVGVSRQKARGIHVARRGRTRGQWCPLRVTASRCVGRGCGTSGAASVLHSSKLQHILGCACVHCT